LRSTAPVSSFNFQAPSFLPAPSLQYPTPSLVGRETELTQFHQLLGKALNGERQIIFVTGEPGIGKTTLVDAFLSGIRGPGSANSSPAPTEPRSPFPVPWLGRGQCLEQYGEGEPYLPVLEALGQMCRGPDGRRVVSVLAQYAPTWLVQMPALVSAEEVEALQRKVAGATRERMLREMAEALEAVTVARALVLVLEDLHWSDHSTVELLVYLARRRAPARLLVIGTYRPTEVVVREHPLKGGKQELHVHGQCVELGLELLTEEHVAEYVAERFGAQGRAFTPEVARLVYRRTDGNALFMVNLVNELITQRMIVQREGRWELKGTVADLEIGIPSSLRQFLEQQLDRLSPTEREVLEAGSVVGIGFPAAAVGAALDTEPRQLEERCAALAQREHFLRHCGVMEWPDGTVSSCYRFTHAMYQEVLYRRIPASRCVEWHRRIGEREEHAYGARAGEIAAELAMHFERGRDYPRAVSYLHQAGANAIRRSAYQEAIHYLTKGLDLLLTLPESHERMNQELRLRLALGLPLVATRGYTAPEIEQTYARAHTLCQQIGETPLLFSALVGLWAFYLVRARLRTARDVASQGLRVAEQERNPAFQLEAHLGLGMISCFSGELSTARAHLERGIAFARTIDPAHRLPASVQDSEVGCLTYEASALWHLGYPDQARARSNEAVTLAHKLAHPFSEVFALMQGAGLHMLRRDVAAFQRWFDEAMTIAHAQGFPLWVGLGTAIRGWALMEQGNTDEGMTQIQQGLAIYQAIGTELSKSFFMLLLAEIYRRTGQTDEGLALLADTRKFIDSTGERLYESEWYRMKGQFVLESRVQSPESENPSPQPRTLSTQVEAEAEACFLKAIDIARQQQAKSLELRATLTLARLSQQQGKLTAARAGLAEIYDWFTEGFDTGDLQEAKTLLAELSQGVIGRLSH
ncbi:MAG: AAA family ATPase, partial [Deltaproteobacteria bacterium]|nr:AAA family ATPase [Deltaproteobacteria bacterium]